MPLHHPDPRAWIRQPSGKHLDLINPDPAGFDDSDLALGLARTFRWGGHSVWPLPLTVAQHSLTVLQLRRQSGDLPVRVQLLELLHDAEEGLVGFDPISPLKPILGDAFAQVMQRLQAAVLLRYGVGDWNAEEHRAHKIADVLAAASEAVHVAGWSEAEVREVLGIELIPLQHDPLVAVYGGTPWEPWPVNIATQRFLEALQGLLKAR
jgi:5'-deoxynucleotidase YfbR-like HD superfamily hydrolase